MELKDKIVTLQDLDVLNQKVNAKANENLLINTYLFTPIYNDKYITKGSFENGGTDLFGWYLVNMDIHSAGNTIFSYGRNSDYDNGKMEQFYEVPRYIMYGTDEVKNETFFTLSARIQNEIVSMTVSYGELENSSNPTYREVDVLEQDEFGNLLENAQDNGTIELGMYEYNKGIQVYIKTKTKTGYVTIDWVKLEYGKVATPYIHENENVKSLNCRKVTNSLDIAEDGLIADARAVNTLNKNMKDMIIIKNILISNKTISSNNFSEMSYDCVPIKQGYTRYLISYSMSNATNNGQNSSFCSFYGHSFNDSNIKFAIRNNASADAKINIKLTVAYLKSSLVSVGSVNIDGN